MAMFQLNTQKFEKLITISYINRGFENTFKEIIQPFFIKVGYLWQTGTITPAQEHFASYILNRKINVAIDGILATPNEHSKKILMFLPEGEHHEIGLLYSYYLLKKQNHLITYLGSSIPFGSIDEINALHQTDYIVTAFTSSYAPEKIAEYLQQLSNNFNKQTILVSGSQMSLFKLSLPENIKIIESPESLLEIIQTEK
jgi:methanogenic corrinoid protein MtbC1